MKDHPQLEAISTLVGTTIGAGILGIPYVVAKAGLLNGIVLILALGFVVCLMNLCYGEVILRTNKLHQLSGYAEKYLGKTGRIIATISFVLGGYGALIAYILGVGSALSAIFGGNNLLFSIGFVLICSYLVYVGIKAIEQSEPVLMALVLLMVILICVTSVGKIHPSNLTGFDLKTFLIPYGLIFFALLGTNAIPEMREELAGKESHLRKNIIIGMIIPILAYLVFTVIVVGVVGVSGFEQLESNNRIATLALIPYIGQHMAILGNLFAFLAMSSSCLAIALSLKEMFILDYRLNPELSFSLAFAPPIAVAFSGLVSFVQVIDVVGVVVGGISGILIVLMFWKAKKFGERKPEYSLGARFLIGVIVLSVVLIGTIYKLLVS